MISNVKTSLKQTEFGIVTVVTYQSDGENMSAVLNWRASPDEAHRWIETQRRTLRRASVVGVG